jgi:hypothetical protein
MADEFDRASDIEMRERESSIAAQNAKAAATPKLQPKGECQNPRCGEEFEPGSNRLFCGPKCAQSHSIYTR